MVGWFGYTRAAAQRLGRHWRAARYERFVQLCQLRPEDSIIDVGAGGGNALAAFNATNPITEIDLRPWDVSARPNVTRTIGDARSLQYADGSFDVAFSNSVIEHMSRDDQQRFAAEIRRVAERYYVQTPNKWFPIEPHYQLPLFQFVPNRVQYWLSAHWKIGWQARGAMETIRLLGARDLHRLFPDATVHRERFLGMTKSLMVVGHRAQSS